MAGNDDNDTFPEVGGGGWPMHIVCTDLGYAGYQPILYMVRLAAELFGAELTVVPPGVSPNRLQQMAGLLTPRTHGGRDTLLLVCPSPACLQSVFLLEKRHRFGRTVAWVFDSFWTNFIPRVQYLAHPFDHVFVTELEDLQTWRRALRVPVSWLPWGTDALRLGSDAAHRPVDLLRVGRQPPGWEEDVATAEACHQRGLCFAGRPPIELDATRNQNLLMEAFSRAKISLSFSNRVNPGRQTHPTREYITARWVDALAAGTLVAGVPPRSASAQALVWADGLLDLGTVDRDVGLDAVADAVDTWTPARAAMNRKRALERLDWRWRFDTVATQLGISPPKLKDELMQLQRRIEETRSPPYTPNEAAASV